MVICWDELDPAGYARTLRDLADWLDWLRGTYRLPAAHVLSGYGLDPEGLRGQLPQGFADPGAGDDFP